MPVMTPDLAGGGSYAYAAGGGAGGGGGVGGDGGTAIDLRSSATLTP